MREIKYRAWLHEAKRMLSVRQIIFMNPDYEGESDAYAVTVYDQDKHGNCHYTIGPDLFTLIQFAGLKDKNGKEIYEGDIVRNSEPEWFNSNDKEYNQEVITNIAALPTERGDWSIDIEDYEIIGNIYENPDLLK